MNIDEAVIRACEETTLVSALSWIAVWETERVVAQAVRCDETGVRTASHGGKWDTCFGYCFSRLLAAWEKHETELGRQFTEASRSVEAQVRQLAGEDVDGGLFLVLADSTRREVGASEVAVRQDERRLLLGQVIAAWKSSPESFSAWLETRRLGELADQPESLRSREEKLAVALAPLVAIAEAYDDDGLDEARPEWGEGIEHDRRVELLCGRGGRGLLTLGQALDARDLLRRLRS